MYISKITLVVAVCMVLSKSISAQTKVSDSVSRALKAPDSAYVALGAITISAKRAAVKQEAGKTTVNVSSLTLGSDGSLLNVLSKIPGLLILSDGTVLLNGQAGVNVMIDDKPTYLSGENLINFLRSIPSGSVDKIELVSQPPARYDANGMSGFINIQRKKKTDQGVNLTVSSNMETGKRVRQNQSTSFSFHRNKMSIYADYSFYSGKDFMLMSTDRQYFNIEQPDSAALKLAMNANRQFSSHSHYIKFGVDYDFSEKLHAGAHLFSNWFYRKKEELVVSDFYQAQ
jgi:outer membrane receptor for ferrienterochelin and colicin